MRRRCVTVMLVLLLSAVVGVVVVVVVVLNIHAVVCSAKPPAMPALKYTTSVDI